MFFFHLPESAQLAHAQMRVRLFLGVAGGVTHPELPTEVADRGARVGLLDGVHDLLQIVLAVNFNHCHRPIFGGLL